MENYITEEGYKTLFQELKFLKEVKRPEIIESIKDARTQSGEITENTEYIEARELQNVIERKIAELESYLSKCKSINTNTINIESGKVIFGCVVDLIDLDTEEELSYQIVGEKESDIKNKKISYTSPLGSSVLGKFEGDICSLRKPDGDYREFEIIKIYKP